MRHVVVDASALARVAFNEDGWEDIVPAMQHAVVHAPTLLRYEMQNVAAKKCRLEPGRARAVIEALERALDRRAGIIFHDPNPVDVVLLAQVTGLSPYDASYLWLAGFLGADLVTADAVLAAAHDGFAVA